MVKNFKVRDLARVLLLDVSCFGSWFLVLVYALPENVLLVFLDPVSADHVRDCVGTRES